MARLLTRCRCESMIEQPPLHVSAGDLSGHGTSPHHDGVSARCWPQPMRPRLHEEFFAIQERMTAWLFGPGAKVFPGPRRPSGSTTAQEGAKNGAPRSLSIGMRQSGLEFSERARPPRARGTWGD